MLYSIRRIGERFASQPDDITSLGNVILTRSRRLHVFLRGDHRRIRELGIKDSRVGVSKMSLPGSLEQSVSSIVFLTV